MSTTLNYGRSGGRSLIALLAFYLLSGLIFIPIVLTNGNLFISATILTTYTMFMIGSLILVEYHAVVISYEDFEVLGYMPITSRTFFFVKLANLLFYVMTFTCVLALPAIITFFFVRGFNPLFGLVGLVTVFIANTTVAFWVVLFYTFILNKVAAHRLKNLMAFFQVTLALVVYSGFFVLPRIVDHEAVRHLSFATAPWLVLLPSAWFSSPFGILLDGTSVYWLLSVLGLCMFALAAVFSTGKLSLNYSSDLARFAALSNESARVRRLYRRTFFAFALSPEERVVAKLIRNQFLQDNKFKMAVLGILPLTGFYLFLGTQTGPLRDPFFSPAIELTRSGMLYLIIFLFPMMLRTFVTQSDSYHASWIFYAAPADLPRLVQAEKNFLMVYFVLPFLITMGCIFAYFFGNILHVLLHILVLGVLSHLFLQVAFLYSPDLPFSRPNVKGRRSRNMAMLIITVPLLIYLLLPLIFTYVYAQIPAYVAFVSMIVFVSFLLEILLRVRVNYYMRKLEFTA